jgi:ubiquitin C-terminal hydrolase
LDEKKILLLTNSPSENTHLPDDTSVSSDQESVVESDKTSTESNFSTNDNTNNQMSLINLVNVGLIPFRKCTICPYPRCQGLIEQNNLLIMPLQNINSVKEGIFEISNEEKIEDFRCDICNNIGETVQTKSIYSVSDLLIIHLNRLKNNKDRLNNLTGKITKPILFEESLEIQVKDKNIQETFTLQSVVCHSGGVNGGHYYTYSKVNNSEADESWYFFNDKSVNKVNLKSFDPHHLRVSGYLLFYKKSTRLSSNIDS